MRIKQIVVAGMAIAMLAGCGNNTTNESANDRGFDQFEQVRNQPGGQDFNDQGMNQFPGNGRQMNNQGGQNRQFNDTAQDMPGRFMEDGRIVADNEGSRRDQGNTQQSNNRSGNRQNQSNQGGQYQASDEIADHVTSEVDDIDGAYVLTMGDTAYVACYLDNDQGTHSGEDVSDRLEKEITNAVKDSDNQINNVYVSSNPDFVDLTSNYMRDVDRGEPIEGLVDQFTEMVERIFPTRN